jgi:hypothetical protein
MAALNTCQWNWLRSVFTSANVLPQRLTAGRHADAVKKRISVQHIDYKCRAKGPWKTKSCLNRAKSNDFGETWWRGTNWLIWITDGFLWWQQRISGPHQEWIYNSQKFSVVIWNFMDCDPHSHKCGAHCSTERRIPHRLYIQPEAYSECWSNRLTKDMVPDVRLRNDPLQSQHLISWSRYCPL